VEPRVSMTGYTIAIVAGLILLALGGYASAGLWSGLGIGAVAGLLHLTYLIQRRAARRMPEEYAERRGGRLVPEHRRRLDRWVLGQWVAVVIAGAGIAEILRRADVAPFDDVGLVLEVLVIGWTVLWTGVYLSALVDWFVVLPKLSGIACPAPCERPGRQRWAGVTAIWCFHRGAARLLVPAVMIGCPTVIGAITDVPAGQAISFAIAGVLAVSLAHLEVEGKDALTYGLNPTWHVGDTLWLIEETTDSVARRPAFLLDIAAEGGKFKYLDASGHYTRARFKDKHDGDTVTLKELGHRKLLEDAPAPCGDSCTGVNWYCWNNPLAHSQTTSGGD
jgi:hypothetical protein